MGQWPPATGQWWTVLKGRPSLEPTKRPRGRLGPRAGIPKRQRPNCHWKEETLKTAWVSSLRNVIEGPRSLASRRQWLLQVVATTAGSWWLSDQCVNKFPSWLSDWRLQLVFFLFQKTRCTCPSSNCVSPASSAEDITCAPPPSRLGFCHLSAASQSFLAPTALTVAAAAERPAPTGGCCPAHSWGARSRGSSTS